MAQRVTTIGGQLVYVQQNGQRVTTLGGQVVYVQHNAQRVTTLGAQVIFSRRPRPVDTGGGPTAPARLPARGGAVYLDSYLEYDGRQAGASDGLFPGAYMTVSGGTTWASGESLTLETNKNVFTSARVGNVVILHAADPLDATTVRLTIVAYTSETTVTVTPDVAVPTAMRSAALAGWDLAVDAVAGLDHLEAKAVGILADDHVVASPNNARLPIITVASGAVRLGAAYAHIYVGLPYLADLETLDIDRPSGSTVKTTRMNVTAVGLHVEKTRPVWVGGQPPGDDFTDPLDGLTELPAFGADTYETLMTGYEDVTARVRGWTQGGRVFVRSVDPVPVTVLAAIPEGFLPET